MEHSLIFSQTVIEYFEKDIYIIKWLNRKNDLNIFLIPKMGCFNFPQLSKLHGFLDMYVRHKFVIKCLNDTSFICFLSHQSESIVSNAAADLKISLVFLLIGPSKLQNSSEIVSSY